MTRIPATSELPLETRSDVRPCIEAALGPPEPHLFRVLECHRPLAPSSRHRLGGVESVAIGRGERRFERAAAERQLRIWVPDPWMSSAHALVARRDGGWFVEDTGSRNGTLVNGHAVKRAELGDGDVVELGRTFFVFRAEAIPSITDPMDLESSALPAIVADLASLSPPLGRQIHTLVQLADSTVSVVVQGETGTGKERIARAVHALSRRSGELVAVNCGALPATLIETELFGCRRGAFTGAQDRPGLVRTAERGTLFLDEIGDLPLPAQVALLRVLQEREVHPIGAAHPVPVDFRVVCATQQPLDALVAAGRFRSDLLARLAGVTVRLPPLRERREDLGMIVATLIRKLAPERPEGLVFDKAAARALLTHPFPLNIRELEKALHSAIALAAGQPIQRAHLALDEPPATAAHATAPPIAVAPVAPPFTAAPPSTPPFTAAPPSTPPLTAAPPSTPPFTAAPPTDPPFAAVPPNTPPFAAVPPAEPSRREPRAPEEVQLRDRLVALLDEHHGNVSATARSMGKARVQIRRWLHRYRIDLDRYRR